MLTEPAISLSCGCCDRIMSCGEREVVVCRVLVVVGRVCNGVCVVVVVVVVVVGVVVGGS